MNIFKSLFFCCAVTYSLAAVAQRPPVPVMDFKDIPVSASTAKKLTADQVAQAIRAAALSERWSMELLGEGILQATFVKESKHTVIVTIA